MANMLTAELREQLHQQLDAILDQLPAGLQELPDAEAQIEDGMRDLGTSSMQAWANCASRSERPPQCATCNGAMRHRGLVERTLTTVNGTITYKRPRRRCDRCGRERYSFDDQLCFGTHGVSWKAASIACRLASLIPSYEMTRQLLQDDYRIEISKQLLEALVLDAGGALLADDDAARTVCFTKDEHGAVRGCKEATVVPDLLAIYADGTMLHTPEDWREIRVGRVMAYDARGERLRQKTFARFTPLDAFGEQLFVSAQAAGYAKAKQKVFLGDGARWLWDLAALHFPEATPILDWYHLSENVHAAAGVVFGEGSDQAKTWAEARLDELRDGRRREARTAIEDLRRQRRGGKREALRRLAGYLKNNAERIDYPRYRAAGLPIGSGPVESMCKTLVGGRCKQAGMRNWTFRGAEAVLRLRAAQFDGDYQDLWNARLQTAI
jgi:hypothetical protein